MPKWRDISTKPVFIELSYEDGEIINTDGNSLYSEISLWIISLFDVYNELTPDFDPERELKIIEIVIHALSSGVSLPTTFHSPAEYDEDRELNWIDIKCPKRLFKICNPKIPTHNDTRYINTEEHWEMAQKIFEIYYDEVMEAPMGDSDEDVPLEF